MKCQLPLCPQKKTVKPNNEAVFPLLQAKPTKIRKSRNNGYVFIASSIWSHKALLQRCHACVFCLDGIIYTNFGQSVLFFYLPPMPSMTGKCCYTLTTLIFAEAIEVGCS